MDHDAKQQPKNSAHPTDLKRSRGTYRVLIVEDDTLTQRMVSMVLKKLGFSFETASNGVECLQQIQAACFDLVLMDVHMPDINGLDATRLIRSGDTGQRNTHIPIIGLSTHAADEDIKACIAAGMDLCLPKPVDATAIEDTLITWLDKQSARANSGIKPLYDRTSLLNNLMQDEDLAATVSTMFIDEAPKAMLRIDTAIAERNWPKLVREVHSFKGASGSISALALAEQAGNIEAYARSLAPETREMDATLAGLLADLKRLLEPTLSAIRENSHRS